VVEARFDAMFLALATPTRRRGMVSFAVGGMLGLLGRVTPRDGAAQVGCSTDADCPGRNVGNDRHICVRCTSNKDCRKRQNCNKRVLQHPAGVASPGP
jgi:hypothetical protein